MKPSPNKKIRELRLIQKITLALSGLYNLQEILEKSVTLISDILKCQRCSVLVFDSSNDSRAVIKAAVGLEGKTEVSSDIIIDRIGKITELIKTSKKSVLKKSDTLKDGFKSKSFLAVPLKFDNTVLGVISATEKNNNRDFTVSEKKLVETLAVSIAMAINNYNLHTSIVNSERQKKELDIARKTQFDLLPAHIPFSENYSFSYLYIPAYEVGGDYFDTFPAGNNKTVVAIGDASGKGIKAALLMVMLRSFLRAECTLQKPLAHIMRDMNRHFYNDLKNNSQFVTLFLGIIDTEKHEFSYCNAGHDYPLLIKNGTISSLKEGGIFLGGIEGCEYDTGKIQLVPGDSIFLYTDGATDARNNNRETYGLERLISNLRKNKEDSNPESVIYSDIQKFIGSADQFDDITLVNIRVKP